MSQTNAPSHSYKNPRIYYQTWKDGSDNSLGNSLGNFYLASRAWYEDSDLNSSSLYKLGSFKLNFEVHFETTVFDYNDCLFVCLFVCLENLAVQPNSEKPGSPNSPTNKKIFLSSFKYDLLNKHVKSSDQQMGGAPSDWSSGAHLYLSGADFKIMKVCSIILVIVMTLALNALLILTASIGTLFLKNVIKF